MDISAPVVEVAVCAARTPAERGYPSRSLRVADVEQVDALVACPGRVSSPRRRPVLESHHQEVVGDLHLPCGHVGVVSSRHLAHHLGG